MTTLRDGLVGLTVLRDQLATGFGVRPYAVTVQLETYAAPATDRVPLLTVTERPLTPAPQVEKLRADAASWYGGGNPVADATGTTTASVYRIGPIPPAHTGGGYAREELVPPVTGPEQRAVILLQGPDLSGAGEPFEVVEYVERPFGIYLTVRRVPIFVDTQ